jgi:ribose-phosphate pyrophosphokinase
VKIISGSSNIPLAEKIAAALNISVTPREIFIFPDAERRIQIQESVVDHEVVIVQPTATPADTNYMETFFLADAAKRSGASSITVVMPYLGYQRQDHVFRDGEAVSLEVVIHMLESLDVDRMVALDLHSIKIPEFFRIPLRHLSALPLFAEIIKENNWLTSDSFLVTPDMGGIRRIKIISELLEDMNYVTVTKDRDLATGSIGISAMEGDIKKRALIVDDMASSGKTLIQASDMLREKGAEEVYAFVTHPIFSQEAPSHLQESSIDKVFVTDSVFVPVEKRFAKLEILSVSGMIAEELRASSS